MTQPVTTPSDRTEKIARDYLVDLHFGDFALVDGWRHRATPQWTKTVKAFAAILTSAPAQGEAVAWPNGCDRTVPAALRYLADHDRPQGGQSPFNAEHLFQLADEIERMASKPLFAAPHVQTPQVSGDKITPLTFAQFMMQMNLAYARAHPGVTAKTTMPAAARIMKDFLQSEKIEFGDPRYDWGVYAAFALVAESEEANLSQLLDFPPPPQGDSGTKSGSEG